MLQLSTVFLFFYSHLLLYLFCFLDHLNITRPLHHLNHLLFLSIPLFPLIGLNFLNKILNPLQDAISQANILSGILKYFLTNLLKIKPNPNLLQNVTNHELHTLTDQIEIIIFIQFVPTMEYIVNCLRIFCWITDLIFNYSGFAH